MKSALRVFVMIVSLAGAYPVFAHHAAVSTYDLNKTTSVQGVVTRFLFRNPHVRVYFEVTSDDGSVTNWVGDGSAATILRREGWTAKTLKAGTRVQIIGPASRDGSPMVMMGSVSLLDKDGNVAEEIFGSVEDFSETYDASQLKLPLTLAGGIPNLSGIWTGQGSPYSPPRGPLPRFSKIGMAIQEAYDITNDPQVFCDKPGLVRQTGMTPHGIRITQHDDRVVFEYEEYGVSNVAYFDSAITNGAKTKFGDSVARYEDGVLIVKTTNLISEMAHADSARMSDQATVVQTYERVDEPEHSSLLKIRTVVTDPVNFVDDYEIVNIKMASAPYDFIENGCVPPLRERVDVHPAMNFFLTSNGPGDGANLGGLKGADAHCEALAETVNRGGKKWRAYLSVTGSSPVNARDRIGNGPWYNAKGDLVAIDLNDLHSGPVSSSASNWSKSTVVTERGAAVKARGDKPNRHDILTGSMTDGSASKSDSDTTCSNWTSNSEGSALVGHFDLVGGGANPNSWNSAHGSRGCSQKDLQGTGGDGLFYCFATQP